ncbi:MAG: glycosyl transferase [Bacteroidota bacterium]|nr:glycosyl transferase [Bacteroidota bacterium]
MAIPKIIHQTFKTAKLPFITRWHINNFKRKNPEYKYEFYDDDRIDAFFSKEFEPHIYEAYKKINIGAVKADMFRYAVLFKKGGIYVDIDSSINDKLDSFINPEDEAIITYEGHPSLYAQWALIYNTNHPFLKRTLEKIIENISLNKYPNDGHRMTGPTVYTEAIKECLEETPSIPYRLLGTDYNGHLRVKYPLGKLFLYKKGEHWKNLQKITPVLKEN